MKSWSGESSQVARRAAGLRALDGRRELGDGRLHPDQGGGRTRRRHRARLRHVSAPEGTTQPDRRNAERRRAADAGHRACPDDQPQGAAPRRAVDGPRSHPRGAASSTSDQQASKRQGTSILLVEQNARMALNVATAGTCCRADRSSSPIRPPTWRPTSRCDRPTWARSQPGRCPGDPPPPRRSAARLPAGPASDAHPGRSPAGGDRGLDHPLAHHPAPLTTRGHVT